MKLKNFLILILAQNLITLKTSFPCRVLLQIHKEDLKQGDFHKVKLGWVDFDYMEPDADAYKDWPE